MDRDKKQVAEALLAYEIFGIDPGASGAIYKYHPKESDNVIKMPKDFEDMVDYFRGQAEICRLPLAFIETQNLQHRDKGGKQFRMEKLLKNYAELISALKLSGMRYIRVHPRTWQSQLRIFIPGEDSKTKKNRHKDICRIYNAFITPTLWNCDALLIAYFGVRKITYDPLWIQRNVEVGKDSTKLF